MRNSQSIQAIADQRKINADMFVKALGWHCEYDFRRRQFRLYSDLGRLMARKYSKDAVLAFVEEYTADRAIRLPKAA